MPWREERHVLVTVATDASSRGWAGKVLEGGLDSKGEIRDYFEETDGRPIHIKELEAVVKTVQSLGRKIQGARLHIRIDNQAVMKAWEGQGGRDVAMNRLLKVLFEEVMRRNVDLKFSYIPSGDNPADAGSRVHTAADAKLSQAKWDLLQAWAGPHSCDLMTLDSNVMRDMKGEPLRHFTPWETPGSSGVDVFAQEVEREGNPYVFPPFIMVMPLLKFLKERGVRRCTVLVPMRRKREVWWCLLEECLVDKMVLIEKGERGALVIPTKKGWDDGRPAPCDFWACKVSFG